MKNLKVVLVTLTLMFALSLSAQKKISQLPELVVPYSTDVLPIVNDDVTKKITVANLLNAASGGGTIEPISKTTAELRALIVSNKLENGAWYINTDYQTIYAQPDYDAGGNIKSTLEIKTGSVEPLLLFAISDNSFAPEAYSLIFPKDKLLYDINVDATFNYGGATNSAPTKGRIYERIDEKNNRTDYDHRVVEFIRYDDGNGYYTVVKDNGNAAQGFLSFNKFLSFNNYFASVYPLSQFVNREFGNNVFYMNLIDNEFSSNTIDNTFSGYTNNNTFSGNVINNTFSGHVSNNTFSGEVYDNNFIHTSNLQYVTIESSVGNRTIKETLYPTFFEIGNHKEIVSDAITGDIYLKVESPSSVTPITYTIIP